MKTRRFILAALAISAAVSCQKGNMEKETRGTESASLITEGNTRTSLEGNNVNWTSDDVIAVFDNTDVKNEFRIAEHSGMEAIFNGSVTLGTTQIYAVYPYSLALSAEGSSLKVNIPADQTSKEGSFAEEHNISVAKATKTPGVEEISGTTFRNVCALLKFTIPSYITDVTKVTLSSGSVIAGEAVIDYSGENPACTVSENGSRSISMTGEYHAGSTFWFVLAPVTLDGFAVTVETAQSTWKIERDTQISQTAGHYKNLGTLELEQVSSLASASHTYSNGVLTGTDVTVSLAIPEAAKPYITDITLNVKDAEGTVIRTFNSSSAVSEVTVPAESSLPYLPQGTYTVSGTYTLSGNTVKDLAEVSFIPELPEFTVTSHAYSSYTLYKRGDCTGANSCAAETIYDIASASVSIDGTILENTNYSGIIGGYAYMLDGNTTTEATAASQSWGEHNVTASFSFDGVTISGSVNCHITGLPYDYSFVDGSISQCTSDGWTTNGKVRISSESLVGHETALVLQHRRYSKVIVVLFNENEKGFVVSPRFHVPSEIMVQPCIHRSVYNAGGDITRTGYVGAVSEPGSSNTAGISYSTSGGNSTGGTVYGADEWMNSFGISSAAPYISIDCDTRNNNDLGCYYFVHEAHFRYAQ